MERVSNAAISRWPLAASGTRCSAVESPSMSTLSGVASAPTARSSAGRGASASPTRSGRHGPPGTRVRKTTPSDDRFLRSRGNDADSGKPIDTWPISCGAFTATVTIW